MQLTENQISKILIEFDNLQDVDVTDICENSNGLDLLTVVIAENLLGILASKYDSGNWINNPIFDKTLHCFTANKICENFNKTSFYNIGEVSISLEEVLKIQEIINKKIQQ